MIVDHIDNYKKYESFDLIYNGLIELNKYLLLNNFKVGTQILNDKMTLIVSKYRTVKSPNFGYEKHTNHIDIQLPLLGLESVLYKPIKENYLNSKSKSEVDFMKDVINISEEKIDSQNIINIIQGNGIFSIFFPGELHSPTRFVNKSEEILKATLKIRVK